MTGNPLYHHDRRIALNALRATFAGWFDRLLAVALILAVLLGARGWALDRVWPVVGWAGLGVGGVIGLTMARRLAARLAFHGFDGVLAADALQPSARRRYLAAWHMIALAAVAVATAVVRPTLLAVTMPGYLLGAFAGHGIGVIIQPRGGSGPVAAGRVMRAWLRRPLAGGGTGVALLLATVMFGRSLDAGVAIALVGLVAAMVALPLSGVDDAIVRFLTATGWNATRVVAHHARGTLLFGSIALPMCGLMLSAPGAAVVGAIAVMALILMAMRVLAYRLYPRRTADLIVSVLIAVLILNAVTMPLVLPIVVIGVLWHLHHRAAAATWLVA